MNERVKELRKTLGLSGEKFGERLGIKRAAVSKIETGAVGLTEKTIKSICREYRVNENWLRTGEGEMFSSDKESFLDEISSQYNLDSFDKKIVQRYIALSKDQRKAVKDYLKSLVDD